VAIKVLPLGTLTDESARKRFRKEALSLSKLNDPNIATVHDFDTQGDVDYLVMEFDVLSVGKAMMPPCARCATVVKPGWRLQCGRPKIG
jgi:hypothetical protein